MVIQSDAGAATELQPIMKIAFRADASLDIGTGHVMRCLTLAEAMTARGATCVFLCRSHQGHLMEHIRSKGHVVHVLKHCAEDPHLDHALTSAMIDTGQLAHSHWLGVTQYEDAKACAIILAELQPDWLIVDHYALDACWEQALKPYCQRMMVIDDLADRRHVCDLLLDQTFGRQPQDYRGLVPENCELLCGSRYALLRPEFAALRPYSLQRRVNPQLKHLLVSLGGVDKDNVTSQILMALQSSPLPPDCRITVVMGTTAPWLNEVKQLAQEMPWLTQVRVGVSDMAQLMADSDLAIGAAGATTWERCCLGLPTIMLVLADNQQQVAYALKRSGAARVMSQLQEAISTLPCMLQELSDHSEVLEALSQTSAQIVDGQGLSGVIHQLKDLR